MNLLISKTKFNITTPKRVIIRTLNICNIKHNDTQNNDTEYNEIQFNDTEQNDTQHNNNEYDKTVHKESEQNETKHNLDPGRMTHSITIVSMTKLSIKILNRLTLSTTIMILMELSIMTPSIQHNNVDFKGTQLNVK
jgi:hypothetical protein